MELTRKKRIGRDARDEQLSVVGGRSDDRAIVRNDVERVHEINVVAARKPFEKRRCDFFFDPVPAHVRNF